MKYFSHSGDLGDIIYSLPAIMANSPATLKLFSHPGKTRVTMTREWAENILPLLRVQPYLYDVEFLDHTPDSSLNGFRHHWGRGQNNADYHLATQGLDWTYRAKKWLWVEPKRVVDVVFARSFRNRGHDFDYQTAAKKYAGRCGFVGTEDEHGDFTQIAGEMPRIATKTLLDAAEIIEGARLFVGNGSAPCAIAEGLKQNMVFEVCPQNNSGIFERMGRINLWDRCVEWPNLDKLPPR